LGAHLASTLGRESSFRKRVLAAAHEKDGTVRRGSQRKDQTAGKGRSHPIEREGPRGFRKKPSKTLSERKDFESSILEKKG